MPRKHPDIISLEKSLPSYAVRALRSRRCWLVESVYKRRTGWAVVLPDGTSVWSSGEALPTMNRHRLRMLNPKGKKMVRGVPRYHYTLKARYCYRSSPFRTPSLVAAELENELESIRRVVGGTALRALRRGKPLNLWRGSSPHNWFVEGSRGILWHSDTSRHGDHPPLVLFDHLRDKDQKIDVPGPAAWIVGSDQGRSYATEYVLRDHLLKEPRFS